MRVAVFGLGYVGTVTAAGLAANGHRVVGVDVDPTKVATITSGRSPVIEPGIDELVMEGLSAGRLTATTDAVEALDGAEVSLICVGTPSGDRGECDLGYLTRVLDDIKCAMEVAIPPAGGHHSIVVRSTVPPGTVDGVVGPVFAEGLPAGWTVGTAMCPEFLREGSSVQDFAAPPLVVVGTADDATADQLTRLFGFLDVPVDRVAVSTAEGLKYACNAFHATKVSFANEIARVMRCYDVDARDVMRLFCKDTKLNISPAYLRPGFAFGGSCLPKDLRSLQTMARANDVDVPLLAGTSLTNELAIRDVVDRVVASAHHSVCILGLSFKNDTDDLRESPNVELAERLLGKGFDVRVYDPIVNPDLLFGANKRHVEDRLPHLNRLLATDPAAALEGAGVVIVSSGDARVHEALLAADPPLVIDLHGRLGADVEQMVGYQGVGW